jgi:hypothetical protein
MPIKTAAIYGYNKMTTTPAKTKMLKTSTAIPALSRKSNLGSLGFSAMSSSEYDGPETLNHDVAQGRGNFRADPPRGRVGEPCRSA